MTNDTALLVIDVQRGMFDDPPAHANALLATITGLVERARAADIPIVYVQHRGGSARHPLHPDKAGFALHPAVAPTENDPVIQKDYPDAFQDTTLQTTLDALGVKHVVIAGLQTEYCIDTTSRRAFSMGYEVTLVQDGHSTWDTANLSADQAIAHHNAVLGSWFATLKPAAEAL